MLPGIRIFQSPPWKRNSVAPSPHHAAIAYCKGTSLRNKIEIRDANGLDWIMELAADAIVERCGDGPVVEKIQAHVMTTAG